MDINLYTLIVTSLIIGYVIGRFFSGSDKVQIVIPKHDHDSAFDSLATDIPSDDYPVNYSADDFDKAIESINNLITEDLAKTDQSFYKVNIPFYVISTSSENAYHKVLSSISEVELPYFETGAIDENGVWVKKMTASDVMDDHKRDHSNDIDEVPDDAEIV